MAKEVVSGDVVEVLEDEGPEEGEIEDDSSDEDNVENYGLCSSNTAKVNTTIGPKYYQTPCTSNSEVHSLKPQAHSEEKTEKCWGNAGRRRYKCYVDHDNPKREAYDRLKKSDLNSDHRGLNFHELLSEYKTSKHGNEGNTHEKENRHYAKEVRLDSSRKRENGVNDVLVDKAKRSKKRKHRRSPSRSPVSSEPDVGRRRKDIKTSRPKRKKKWNANNRNSKESAQIFARIRASKLNLASEQKKTSVDVINVASEGENPTEVSELSLNNSRRVLSEGECNPLEKNIDSETNVREGECFPKEPTNYDSSKGLSAASDTQTAEKIEDSVSEDDDVHQLRMIALQSAFRAKYLTRKRMGLVKRRTNKIVPKVSVDISNVDTILDDTAELLEAAVEESVTACVKEPESNPLCTSLSEVPLPPEPENLPVAGTTLAEDLTPVDMELALTDEEDNTEQGKGNECDGKFEDLGGEHPKVRISCNLTKTRNIPVTIGRNQHYKVRQRSFVTDQENSRRSNLLEVRTLGSDGMNLENVDSGCVSMEELNMCSMIILDSVGTTYPPESCHALDEDQTLSEASDAKSDLIPAFSDVMLGNDNDDEDEELLRAKLLLDISSRHRKEEAMIKSALAVQGIKTVEIPAEKVATHYLVRTVQPQAGEVNSQIKINGNSTGAPTTAISQETIKAKRNMERIRKGQLMLKAQAQKSAHSKQFPITTFMKGRTSKISNRGKYQRVNQNRMAMIKKRLDGNLQVTVPGSSNKSKAVSKIPQQQDRIVICLAEDSDDSDDEKQKAVYPELADHTTKKSPTVVYPEIKVPTIIYPEIKVPIYPQMGDAVTVKARNLVYPQMDDEKYRKVEPQMDDTCHIIQFPGVQNQKVEPQMDDTCHIIQFPGVQNPLTVEQLMFAGSVPVGSVSVDFEKSVDLFLKEVRSVQESKSKHSQAASGPISEKVETCPAQLVVAKPKVAANAPTTQSAKPNLKSLTGVTPQAVRHLPFPQQEEYRRLKMQISILEMQKKRKAGETSQALPKIEQKGIPVNSAPVLKLDQTTPAEASEENRSNDNESSNLPSSHSNLSPKDLTAQEKPLEKDSNGGITTLMDGGIDDDNEDENLMREQLLRSRLRKRVAAKTEVPSPKMVLLAESNADEASLLSKQEVSTGELSQPEIIVKDGKSYEVAQHQMFAMESISSKGSDASSMTQAVFPEAETECKTQSKSEKIPSTTEAEVTTVEVSYDPLKVHSVDENKLLGKQVMEAKEDVTKKVTQKVCALSEKVTQKVSALAEMSDNAAKTKTGQSTSSVMSIPAGTTGLTKTVNAQTKLAPNHENHESRESQLKELELQLLSERHAALEYLRELSLLLNTMELEGNRLKEKAAAVRKLRAELSFAEVALHTQKRLMKQLALNVSTTHAHVTETRHKCTLLSRACLKLGNQIKQEEVANGGEKSVYKVPTGVAELVKSHLSSVLYHTKQLKKSGLPILGLSQEFINKDSYPVKKPGKRFVPVVAQPHPMQWSKQPSPTNRSNLKIEKKNPMFTPSKFAKAVKNNTSLVKSCAGNKPISNSEPAENVGTSSTSIAWTLPATKSLVTVAKSSVPPKSISVPKTSSTTVNQNSAREVHVPDSLDKPAKVDSTNVVAAGASSVTKEGVAGWSRTMASVSSFTLVPSDSSKKALSEKAIQLRDYDSPLESISRTSSEKLTADVSSHSREIQSEDTVILDPNIMLCPYDLMGVCQDEECTYQHQRRKGAVKES